MPDDYEYTMHGERIGKSKAEKDAKMQQIRENWKKQIGQLKNKKKRKYINQ